MNYKIGGINHKTENISFSPWQKYKKPKPCPFCNEYHLIIGHTNKIGWYVVCDVCRIKGPIGRTEKSAVDKWNKRKSQQ